MTVAASISPGNSFYNETYRWLEKPSGFRKLALKPTIKVFDWAEVVRGSLPQSAVVSKKILSRTNYLLRWADLPQKVSRWFEAIARINFRDSLWTTVEAVICAFKRTMSLFEFSALGMQICHNDQFIILSPRLLAGIRTIGFIGSFASFLKSIIDIKDIFYHLKDTHFDQPRKNLEIMRLVSKIISLVASIFGMGLFLLGAASVAKWVLLSVSTASLVMSISKYYYRRLCVNPTV